MIIPSKFRALSDSRAGPPKDREASEHCRRLILPSRKLELLLYVVDHSLNFVQIQRRLEVRCLCVFSSRRSRTASMLCTLLNHKLVMDSLDWKGVSFIIVAGQLSRAWKAYLIALHFRWSCPKAVWNPIKALECISLALASLLCLA
jgi:hypothetical protein